MRRGSCGRPGGLCSLAEVQPGSHRQARTSSVPRKATPPGDIPRGLPVTAGRCTQSQLTQQSLGSEALVPGAPSWLKPTSHGLFLWPGGEAAGTLVWEMLATSSRASARVSAHTQGSTLVPAPYFFLKGAPPPMGQLSASALETEGAVCSIA